MSLEPPAPPCQHVAMTSSVVFALLSLSCAGVNDVVFKRYAAKDRSRGMYVCGIGLVWAALQLAMAHGRGVALAFEANTLGYGAAAGVLLTASNLLLLESLTHIDASLGSTIYRLNTVGVVLLSLLLLHEPLGFLKGLGVSFGVAAVFLLYRRTETAPASDRRFSVFFALAIAAALFRAVYGVTSKAGLLDGAELQPMLLLGGVSWIIGGAGYALFREKRFRVTRKKLFFSAVSGALVFLIVNFLLLAIEDGQASIAIPIANMSFVVALLLSVALGMESLTRCKVAAVALSAISILLLSLC